ncbi:2-C-methyl-D-erythritol 4-phosphate cytidylyltransferase [Gulosibacter sp. 10]|uniref:2-C-methyl-D-erythritol 4-phosphate cytidylyltransferase n=1 Tax=Gulosibacter sp. 10 TaxID=1255570 RepID=UPI000B35C71B|nr:2-C-methyl-D-erythritol 4-phosphate cytidylyltransferase [Gulosibacter sp. 10]
MAASDDSAPVRGEGACTGVVIVAAGSGTRLGLGRPKAFAELGGEPMLAHALRGLLGLPGRVAAAVVVPPEEGYARQAERLAAEALAPLGSRLVSAAAVPGGASRHASVRAGLEALPADCDVLLVHDAARPFASGGLFAAVAGAVRATGGGVVPGLPVTDTVKRVDGAGLVERTVDREALRAVQTPQGFPSDALRDAYRRAPAEATDDAGIFAAAGGRVEVVPGEDAAFKITSPADLERAGRILAERDASGAGARELRVGTGTDVHAFDDESPCRLAGIEFPGERGLSGHSDGDAASHALVDALLGAAGLGSIGSVFGTDDPRFADAAGAVFLEATRELLEAHGCRIRNASVQVVCRRPRFGDRAAEASAVLSGALGAPVSVSATTSDGLGFTGDADEGVLAIATALVEVPAAAPAFPEGRPL